MLGADRDARRHRRVAEDARGVAGGDDARAELERPPSADSIAARNYQNVFPDEELAAAIASPQATSI